MFNKHHDLFVQGHIKCTFRFLVHGKFPQEFSDEKFSRLRNCGVEVLEYTPSNSAGCLSTVQITPTVEFSRRRENFALAKPLRAHLDNLQFPVMGESEHTRPLPGYRDRGLLMALIKLQITDGPLQLSFGGTEPHKFGFVRERELRFFEKSYAAYLDALEGRGEEPQADLVPVPYITGVKVP